VIGVKCAALKAKLLKEFYSQLGSPANYKKQIGIFVPTGMVHLLGTENYANLLKDRNTFLNSVVNIPVGDFQHETLDIPFSLDTTTNIDQTTLLEVTKDQNWCLNLKKTKIPNKVLVMTTKQQLAMA